MSIDWSRLPSLSALRAFDATARHNGFAGAARSLNVTHAAIAQQVRGLEKELGIRLAVRTGRSVTLTETGVQLAQALNEGFSTIDQGLARIRDTQDRRGLRISTTPLMIDRIIVPRLSEFWVKYPNVEIALSPSRDYVDIVEEGYDLAIRAVPATEPADWPGMSVHRVATVPVIVIAAPTLLAERGSDLQDLPWIWHDSMGMKLMILRDIGLDPDTLTQVRIGSPNLQLEAVKQGIGVALFNERIARPEIESGDIVEVATPNPNRVSYVAVIPNGPRHRLVDPFVDWVETLF